MSLTNLGHGGHEMAQNLGMGRDFLFRHKDIATNLVRHDLQNIEVLGNELWCATLSMLRWAVLTYAVHLWWNNVMGMKKILFLFCAKLLQLIHALHIKIQILIVSSHTHIIKNQYAIKKEVLIIQIVNYMHSTFTRFP